MSTSYIIGLSLFLLSFLVSRFLNENAMKELNNEEKARLMDDFSNFRKYSIIPVIVLILAFVGINHFYPGLFVYSFVVYMTLLILFIVGISVVSFRKIAALALPQKFSKKFITSQILRYIGIAALFASLIVDFVLR